MSTGSLSVDELKRAPASYPITILLAKDKKPSGPLQYQLQRKLKLPQLSAEVDAASLRRPAGRRDSGPLGLWRNQAIFIREKGRQQSRAAVLELGLIIGRLSMQWDGVCEAGDIETT